MSRPLLVVIDVQKEYVTKGRAYFIEGIEPSLAAGKRVLEHARKNGWEVVHVRHLQDGELFGKGGAYSGFVEGFEPRAGENEIIKGDYSCYSTPEFAKRLAKDKERPVYVIGYGSTKCCLATIVDGYHRGQKLFFVCDASNAKRSERFDERDLHARATDILASYCTVLSSDQIV